MPVVLSVVVLCLAVVAGVVFVKLTREQATNSILQHERSTLKERLDGAERECLELQSAHAALKDESGILAAQLEALRTEREELLSSNALLHHGERSLQGQLDTLQTELAELQARHRDTHAKYAEISDVDVEFDKRRAELREYNAQSARTVDEQEQLRQELAARYQEAKALYDRLLAEVSKLEENLEDISFGLYRAHYNFDTSAEYRHELDLVREKKKAMIREGTAATCPVSWAIGGNRREGERMTKQQMKVMLRAFNGESDAALANVTWNNIDKIENRLQRAFESINELGSVNKITISPEYYELSVTELRLADVRQLDLPTDDN